MWIKETLWKVVCESVLLDAFKYLNNQNKQTMIIKTLLETFQNCFQTIYFANNLPGKEFVSAN